MDIFPLLNILCPLAFAGTTTALVYAGPPAHNISSPKLTDWGDWGPLQSCPSHGTAFAFQLKTESPQGFLKDDTALNAIRLSCVNIADLSKPSEITSTEGPWGVYGQVFECKGKNNILTGFQFRSEKPSYPSEADDTAANNIRFWCNNSKEEMDYIEGDGAKWGEWTEAQHCGDGFAICGIMTQVEPFRGPDVVHDDTALNNVVFQCCPYEIV